MVLPPSLRMWGEGREGSRRAAQREAGAGVVDGDEAEAGHGGACLLHGTRREGGALPGGGSGRGEAEIGFELLLLVGGGAEAGNLVVGAKSSKTFRS